MGIAGAPLSESRSRDQARQGVICRSEIKYEEVVAQIVGWNNNHGAATPIAGLGILLIRKLVQKYAPRLVAAFLGDWALLIIGIVKFTAIAYENMVIRCRNRDAVHNFAIDEKRRSLDVTLGQRNAS